MIGHMYESKLFLRLVFARLNRGDLLKRKHFGGRAVNLPLLEGIEGEGS